MHSMLQPGRLPLNAEEHEAINKLIIEHERTGEVQVNEDGTLDANYPEDVEVSLTRRDPGNTGPVIVHFTAHDLDDGYFVHEDGKVERATRQPALAAEREALLARVADLESELARMEPPPAKKTVKKAK